MHYADHLAALRLEELNEIKRTREQEKDYADVCYVNEQLGKQLHAANNSIMSLQMELRDLQRRIDSHNAAHSEYHQVRI